VSIVARWLHWSSATTNRKIFRASLTIASITFGVKIISFFKGNGRGILVWHQRCPRRIPGSLSSPHIGHQCYQRVLQCSFGPDLYRVREQEGPASAQRLLSSVMTGSIILLIVAAVVIMLAASLIFRDSVRL